MVARICAMSAWGAVVAAAAGLLALTWQTDAITADAMIVLIVAATACLLSVID